MSLLLVGLCLAAVVGLYFYNNPLKHGSWFMTRRFINWFPLGMTYAFLYMARYNLTVSKTALGSLMSNKDFGTLILVDGLNLDIDVEREFLGVAAVGNSGEEPAEGCWDRGIKR